MKKIVLHQVVKPESVGSTVQDAFSLVVCPDNVVKANVVKSTVVDIAVIFQVVKLEADVREGCVSHMEVEITVPTLAVRMVPSTNVVYAVDVEEDLDTIILDVRIRRIVGNSVCSTVPGPESMRPGPHFGDV